MCDYSLEMYGSRPAREGELYVTTRFPSGSIGFAAPGDPRIPVCVQCDTKVVLTDIPVAMQATWAIGAEVQTTFAQRDTGLYRDGLRLADGRFVSLQDLPVGVGAYIPTLLEREGANASKSPKPSTDDGLILADRASRPAEAAGREALFASGASAPDYVPQVAGGRIGCLALRGAAEPSGPRKIDVGDSATTKPAATTADPL